MKILGFHIARELPVREVVKTVTVFVPGEPAALKAWEVDVSFTTPPGMWGVPIPVRQYFANCVQANKAHPGRTGREVTLYKIGDSHYRAFSVEPVFLNNRKPAKKA